MNIEEYNNLQKHENNKVVAIDFDGVIHKNSKGFHDGTVYDEPVTDSLRAIKWFYHEGYEIVIFTAKAKPDRPLVNGKTGKELVKDWLIANGFWSYIRRITSEKPRAIAYIDDKGIRFNNWTHALQEFRCITSRKN